MGHEIGDSRIKGRTHKEEKETEAFIHIFILLFYFSSLILFFILRIRVVDLSYNIELGCLYIKLH